MTDHSAATSFVRAYNTAIFAYARHDGGNFFRERKLDISIPPLNEFKDGPSYSAAAFVGAMMSISTGRTNKLDGHRRSDHQWARGSDWRRKSENPCGN
ncbi:hypothetical protein niasHS_013852 [Heterodera schachtii]|uniref:Uncharacterized protein n=1 Tax=Heterodera schachtii TaxID=97005 RepID=A0ABD2IQS5_HETSC